MSGSENDLRAEDVKFACCYCGEFIVKLDELERASDSGEISQIVFVHKNEEQSWFGHYDCFKKTLLPKYQSMRWEDDSAA